MNFINNIEIKNFKSIRHQKIEGCKRINIFVGPPNVGKSNILEALGLFSVNTNNSYFGDFVRFGKPTTLFFNGHIHTPSEVIINAYFRGKLKSTKSGNIDVSFELDRNREGFENIDSQIMKALIVDFSYIDSKIYTIGNFLVDGIDKKISQYQGINELRIYKETTEDLLSDNNYNNNPIIKYEFKKNVEYNSDNTYDLTSPHGENLFDVILTNYNLSKSIIEIFDNYGLKFLYDTESQGYKILKMVGNMIFTVPYPLTADTLQRLIFYKAAIYSNINSILLFEEPEANCYEPYIMEITNAIKNDKNENQFFIVTHSQYVIDELMRDEESRDDTNIYLVGLEENETKVKLLSAEASKEAYQTGLNLFFNYQTLWDEN